VKYAVQLFSVIINHMVEYMPKVGNCQPYG
jgi:hypothetical protein